MMGRVTFVGAGPGDPDLITVKGYRALREADVILQDSLAHPELLEGVRARLLYVGKRCGKHSMTQDEINRLLVRQALKGRHVVRLKGGDCAVLGRLGEELLALAAHNIPFDVVPGVTSATSVPTYAGIPITHRGLADSFAVATAHLQDDSVGFSIPAFNPNTTVVLLMSVGTTAAWREQLLNSGYPTDLPIAFISEGTRPTQQVLITNVDKVAQDMEQSGLPTPALAVVGRVVTLHKDLAWFRGEDETLQSAAGSE